MIFSWEDKVLKWITDHIILIALVAVTLLSVAIRYALRGVVNGDATTCLLPWYEAIKENGGMAGLATPVEGCNYNFPYLFFIAIMTYLPIKPLYAYKLFSCIFDYLLGFSVAALVYELSSENRQIKAILSYILVVMSPIVFLDSAAWAQCDSIYVFFAVMALLMLVKEKYLPAFILYGVSFAFKFQAIFLMPFFLFYYLYKRKFSLLYFLCIPASMIVLSLPAVVQGRSILEIFTIYTNNSDWFQSMSMNYPSFWLITNDDTSVVSYATLKMPTMIFTVVVLGVFMALWIHKKVQLAATNCLYMAFVLAFTTVIFLPAMHERYGYLYEILGLAIIFVYKRTIPLYIALFVTSLITYGKAVFGRTYNSTILAIALFAVYVFYMIVINRELIGSPYKGSCQRS